MSLRRRALALLVPICLVTTGCLSTPTPEQQYANIEAKTGLRLGDDGFLTKTIRAYPMTMRIQAGDVWGRYAARVAIGETGRQLGGFWRILTGSYEHVGTVVGSPLDRLLSRAIGQPLSLIAVLKHGKPGAPRLDVLSEFSTIQPEDPQPVVARVGFTAGDLRTADAALAARVSGHTELMRHLSRFRSQYIRIDEHAVSFFFAGSEREYSGMIQNHGSYENFLNSIADSLADLADAI